MREIWFSFFRRVLLVVGSGINFFLLFGYEFVTFFLIRRDTGDEILKGWLFMVWFLMDIIDVILWFLLEENSFLGRFRVL